MGYMLSALIITFIIPFIGVLIGFVRKIIYSLMSVISPIFAFAVANYLTFPGVMHHEISHALLGALTGAKITKINLFKPNGNSLGSVQMIYRGPWLFRCIQGCMSAIGPVVVGIVTCLLTWMYLLPVLNGGFGAILVYYLLFSIVLHMTMSSSDMLCFFRGAVGVYIIALLICFLARIDLLTFIR